MRLLEGDCEAVFAAERVMRAGESTGLRDGDFVRFGLLEGDCEAVFDAERVFRAGESASGDLVRFGDLA